MVNPLNRENENCQRFRDVLDTFPTGPDVCRSLEVWRAHLPETEAQHLAGCQQCLNALEEFAETRKALLEFATPEPGPWFTTRVMAAINAKEREEEATDGVWISVRRLAPRMVALSALLLVLGGSWAVQQRSRDLAANGKSGDMVFDSSSSVPGLYDDSLATTPEVRP